MVFLVQLLNCLESRRARASLSRAPFVRSCCVLEHARSQKRSHVFAFETSKVGLSGGIFVTTVYFRLAVSRAHARQLAPISLKRAVKKDKFSQASFGTFFWVKDCERNCFIASLFHVVV